MRPLFSKRGSLALKALASLCLAALQAGVTAQAQDANAMYKDTGNDKRRYDAIQQENKEIVQGLFYQALQHGQLWRCASNVYLFCSKRWNR